MIGAPGPGAAVRLDGITLSFGGKTIIKRFSLQVDPGEKVTIAGRSGSGKTSLLRCILGFVIPDEGAIYIYGQRLTKDTVWTLRTKLAYVAQEPDLGTGTVEEVLERPFLYKVNRHLRHNLEQAPGLFDTFLLAQDRFHQPINALSGGEKQRVALISSILLDRSVFLLDEATSALDRASKAAVVDYFRARADATVVSVSHDIETFNDQVVELTPAGDSVND